jgi:serine kinase of HPr protein (carbohydrate metabolism regulator)
MSPPPETLLVHATTVTSQVDGNWLGVLLMGPSGAGKSDLALRLMRDGFRLVSDDYSRLFVSGKALYATPPKTIEGLMEIRGIGIETALMRPLTQLNLAIWLQAEPLERLPYSETTPVLGHFLPTLRLNPFETSLGAKIHWALKSKLIAQQNTL